MRKRHFMALTAPIVAFLAAGTALADDIVHFTNGTSMAVRSHRVEKEMIHVDLGANASMAFPLAMVEKVERSGHAVFANPAFVPANQAVASASTSASSPVAMQPPPVTGEGNVPAYSRSARRRQGLDPEQQAQWAASQRTDRVESPMVNSGPVGNRVKMRSQMVGQIPGDPEGATRRGDVLVLNPSSDPSRSKGSGPSQAVAFGPKATNEPAVTTPGMDDAEQVADAPPAEGGDAPPPDDPGQE